MDHCGRTTLVILVSFRYLDDHWCPPERVGVARLTQDGWAVSRGGTARDTTLFAPSIYTSQYANENRKKDLPFVNHLAVFARSPILTDEYR